MLLVLLLLNFFGIHAQVNLNLGLLGHWPLDGNAVDISGNNRIGVVNGNVRQAADRFGGAGKAIELDGNGSYIVVSDADGSLLPDKFSICAWFQTTSSNVQTVVGKILFNQVPINEQVQLYINWPITPGIGSVIVPEGAPCNQGHTFAESRLFTGEELCRGRWYFMVVSFDGNIHRLYLDGQLKASRAAGFSEVTSCIGNLQFGAWWNGDRQYFKGFMDDIRVYNRAITQDEVDTLYGVGELAPKYDFSYRQDLCNPKQVSFFYNGPGSEVLWDFEPGIQASGRRPVHIFSENKDYPIRMVVRYDDCRTNDTINKSIRLQLSAADLLNIQDTTICLGASLMLRANVNQDFCWDPDDYLDNPLSAEVSVTPLQDTKYFFTHKYAGPNLVMNGDFSAGNTGFTTTYAFRANNTTEGEYFVSAFPQAWNTALSQCVQPNGQAGNMMLVNGVPEPNKVVWQQELVVNPNSTYDFGVSISALYPVNPAQLQFSVNQIIIGDSISANGTPCTWSRFNTTWNSGNATKAVISIVNRNTEVQGNDFALDNITFNEVNLVRDSVTIRVVSSSLKITADTMVCRGAQLPLIAEGAETYLWSPAAGLNNPAIPNPVANVTHPVRYYLEASTLNGTCIIRDSVTVSLLDDIDIRVTPVDAEVCGEGSVNLLAESAGTTFLWTPSAGLSNPFVANPVATVNAPVTYYVKVTDELGCFVQDSISITWQKSPEFDIFPKGEIICRNEEILLKAIGGTRYEWAPSPWLVTTTGSEVVARPLMDAVFKVRIWHDVCRDSTTLTTGVQVQLAPSVGITKSNDLDCNFSTAQLEATGGITYRWEPASGLSNPAIANPIANPSVSTLYSVVVTDEKGCEANDTISVLFTNAGDLSLYQLPSAFTPNGDGLNDCFGIKKWGTVEITYFDIFNRWGQKIFSGFNRTDCWDGSFKGIPQPSGTYVYKLLANSPCGLVKLEGLVTLIR